MADRPSIYLVGDIGATNARLALAKVDARRVEWLHMSWMTESQCFGIDDALGRLFAESPVPRTAVSGACLGIAAPILGRRAELTNRDWSIDADAIAASLGGAEVALVNDLEAAAVGIDALDPPDFVVLQEGLPAPQGARLVVGAGTGMGVAYAISCGGDYVTMASEAGHSGFSPQSAQQSLLHDTMRALSGRVEVETLVSGAGIERIYAVLRDAGVERESPALRADLERGQGASAIARRAHEGDRLAVATLELFVDCYGAFAGDQALCVLAHGGVFVVGGIAPRILAQLIAGRFVRAFNDKGRFARLTQSFPIAVVTNDRLGLLGAALLASRHASGAATGTMQGNQSGCARVIGE